MWRGAESSLENLNIDYLNFKTDCQIENTRLARRILKGKISELHLFGDRLNVEPVTDMNGILVRNVRENSRVTIMSALLIQKIGLLSTQGLNITSAHTALDNLSVEPPRRMLSLSAP